MIIKSTFRLKKKKSANKYFHKNVSILFVVIYLSNLSNVSTIETFLKHTVLSSKKKKKKKKEKYNNITI